MLLPAGIKFPPIEKEWQNKPHTFAQACVHGGNAGVLAGNGFIGLDQDDPSAFDGLELSISTKWETRPGRFGMWFKAADVAEALESIGKRPDQAQLKLFKNGKPCGEVKLQRTYQVIPNSWKTLEDGTRADYKLLSSEPPAEVSLVKLLVDLQSIGITFSSKLDQNAAKLEERGKKARQKHAESDESRTRRYAEAALRDEVLILAGTPGGNRNEQLNKSAFALGQFVAAGVLSEGEVLLELSEAAENTGLDSDEIRKTILSGLDAGRQHPREIPEKTRTIGSTRPKASGIIELEEIAEIEYDKNGKIKKSRLSPTQAARVVLERMPLAMSEDSEDIYHFTGQIYKPNGARAIDQAICSAAGDLNTAHQLKEILRRVRNTLLDNPVVFEPNAYLLGVKNGVADLLTGEVREYRREDLILEQLDVNYDPSARCPTFLAFLESITPNVSDRITLIDWFAATAIKEPFAYVLFLLGLGRNGKGIYEKLIKKFFGKTAFRDMPLAEVAKNNFAAGGFYRKRGWIASETGKKKAAIGTDFMKLTSGNGSIDGDRKNQSRIQFDPYFQTVVDTNTMPKIEDSSIGWQERFVKVDLPYVFVADPDHTNPLERQRDPALFDKLSTPSELSGILNLLLFRSQVIGTSKAIHKRSGAEMFAEYAEQSASVGAFLNMFCEYIEEGPDFWTPSAPVYEAYKEWCGYKVGEVVDVRYFGKQLKTFCGGLETKQGKEGKDGDRKNIRLYRRLNFDGRKYKAALEALQLSMSSSSLHVSSSCLHEDEEENSQQITMSSLSLRKQWIEIYERFGDNTTNSLESYSREKKSKFMKNMKTMKTTRAGDVVDCLHEGSASKTSMKTNTIKDELLQAEEQHKEKEEHFSTKTFCTKCGEDLTGHGVVERAGKAYCARPGCGYPAREETSA